MTEELELLLKDLCCRLPYGVKGTNAHGKIVDLNHQTDYSPYMSIKNAVLKHEWRPYLFPLSSMTEEQEKELNNYLATDKKIMMGSAKEIDWLYKHHFDVHNLIHYGLAINAIGKNIY